MALDKNTNTQDRVIGGVTLAPNATLDLTTVSGLATITLTGDLVATLSNVPDGATVLRFIHNGNNLSLESKTTWIDNGEGEYEVRIIKYDTGVIRVSDVNGGSGASGGIENRYATVVAMLSDQTNQTDKGIQFVTDASYDPFIGTGHAYYEYLGYETADLGDYKKISTEEGLSGGISSEDQAKLDLIFSLYVPDAPTIATSISGDDISVDITAGANNGFAITGYRVELQTDSGGYTTIEASTTDDPYVIVNPGAGVHDVRIYAINSIGESAVSNVDSETIASTELIDDFTGTTPDTAQWDIFNPGTTQGITISQNNVWTSVTDGTQNSTSAADYWQSKISFDGRCAASIDTVSINHTSYIFPWWGIYVDDNNYAIVFHSSNNFARFSIKQGGLVRYDQGGLFDVKGKRIKIVIDDSNNITLAQQVIGNGTWTPVNIGAHQWNLGAGKKFRLRTQNVSAQAVTVTMDRARFVEDDHTTELP